ncbi:hypothetical protein ONA24_06435 [Mycoplasmopsis cynos]|nr:hypothetical protein [Mycoplasmopsis cynos]WAM09584.1 hypothetical protein ONA24_06435 [Mycoplasmopsis cynos]
MKLFNTQMLEWIDEKIDWKEAIHKGVELLVNNNKNSLLNLKKKFLK